jgi:small-conductance mechanosensitive channel
VSDIDLTAPEVQAAIAAAVEKATAPLVAKRDELLGEVKKLRKNVEIDPADLEKVEAERDQLKQQLAEANKTAKQAAKQAEDATKKLADAEGFTQKLLVDNGLSEALAKAGVTNPVHIKAAKAMLAAQVQIADDNGAKVARMGDKALADAITEWAGSDEGKYFVAPVSTSGDGAQGGRRTTTQTKSLTRSAFDALAPAERSAHIKSGGEVTD